MEEGGGRLRFTADLKFGETTFVCWKKLLTNSTKPNETNLSNPEGSSEASSNRQDTVVEQIEPMHVGEQEDVLDDVHEDYDSDTDDSFLDDTQLDDYFQVDDSATEDDGIFPTSGKLERTGPTILETKPEIERGLQDSPKVHGGSDAFPARNEGSSVRRKKTELDKAIRDLERIVSEFRPPPTEVPDPHSPSGEVKKRLSPEIKQMLAEIATISEDIYGPLPKCVIDRLMRIVGHLMQVRTVKTFFRRDWYIVAKRDQS